MTPKDRISAIIMTGLLAGTLDGGAALVNYSLAGGTDFTRVFLYIASGAFGKDAVLADPGLWWWGAVFHYMIALGWTTLFFILYPSFKALSGNFFGVGAAYGVAVWLVMNRVVVPLSRVPPGASFSVKHALIGAGILVVCIGIPISFFARRFYRKFRIATELERNLKGDTP